MSASQYLGGRSRESGVQNQLGLHKATRVSQYHPVPKKMKERERERKDRMKKEGREGGKSHLLAPPLGNKHKP